LNQLWKMKWCHR